MRQRVDGLRRGKKLDTDRVVARVQFAMAQHGHDTRRSGLFLRGKRAMFTLTAKPFTVARADRFFVTHVGIEFLYSKKLSIKNRVPEIARLDS